MSILTINLSESKNIPKTPIIVESKKLRTEDDIRRLSKDVATIINSSIKFLSIDPSRCVTAFKDKDNYANFRTGVPLPPFMEKLYLNLGCDLIKFIATNINENNHHSIELSYRFEEDVITCTEEAVEALSNDLSSKGFSSEDCYQIKKTIRKVVFLSLRRYLYDPKTNEIAMKSIQT